MNEQRCFISRSKTVQSAAAFRFVPAVMMILFTNFSWMIPEGVSALIPSATSLYRMEVRNRFDYYSPMNSLVLVRGFSSSSVQL